MENSISSNIKGKPILDNYIKDLLLENKRTWTLNHKEPLKGFTTKWFIRSAPLGHHGRGERSCTSGVKWK